MERKQLESAAVSYPYLRGLFALPLGVIWILTGLSNLEWGPFGHTWVFFGSALVALAAYLPITRYYEDNYGRVTPKTRQERAVLGTSLAVLVMIGGPILVQELELPVNGLGAAWALVVLAYYALTVGLKAHHLVIWGSLLVASLLPVWGDPATSNSINVAFLAIGGAAIATGIFDHRLLVQTLGSSRDLNLENSNVGA